MIDDTRPPEPTGGESQVVMLHGFSQTRRCLGPIAAAGAVCADPLLVDLPGHGRSASLAHMDCPAAAEWLADRFGPSHWVGYSMGARIALNLGVHRPDAVLSLALIGATPGIGEPQRRAQRRRIDEERAARLEEIGVERFAAEWLGAEMFAALPDWARFEHERRSNTVEGLAGSLRNAGTGSMEPLWHRLPALGVPVLCMAGSRDAPFSDTARDMAEAIGPNAVAVSVPDAGHAAHLENPEAAVRTLQSFLQAVRA